MKGPLFGTSWATGRQSILRWILNLLVESIWYPPQYVVLVCLSCLLAVCNTCNQGYPFRDAIIVCVCLSLSPYHWDTRRAGPNSQNGFDMVRQSTGSTGKKATDYHGFQFQLRFLQNDQSRSYCWWALVSYIPSIVYQYIYISIISPWYQYPHILKKNILSG